MTPGAGALLAAAGFAAGVQNALAGGGSFLTLPALILAGADARAANITSTVALFPGQVATGLAGRSRVAGTPALAFRWLFVASLLGGAAGARLLLATPPAFFERLVPWLVLFATVLFAAGSLRPRRTQAAGHGGLVPLLTQTAIGIYGGYFGGGIGFLMLAVLSLAGMELQAAQATKNVLAGAMNAAAVAIFAFSPGVAWAQAAVLAAGALAGGQVGARLLPLIDDRKLRVGVVAIGLALTVGMFWRARG